MREGFKAGKRKAIMRDSIMREGIWQEGGKVGSTRAFSIIPSGIPAFRLARIPAIIDGVVQ